MNSEPFVYELKLNKRVIARLEAQEKISDAEAFAIILAKIEQHLGIDDEAADE